MNGARDINKKIQLVKGSATVEATIVLPFFFIVLLSLAYIIRLFYAYNTVQASLSEVARSIGNVSYFYHVSGLKDYSDQLNEMSKKAENTIDEQKNTVIEAYTSFNDMISKPENSINSGFGSVNDIRKLLEETENFKENMTTVTDLIQSIVSDPKAELQLVLTVFTQRLSYEVTNRIVCSIARESLGREMNKRIPSEGDAAALLGIKNGIEGMDFQQSSIFGDTESLEFKVHYSIKAPAPFGIIPELQLSNRVKVIAWTGGRGQSVKLENERPQEEDTAEDSLWIKMDQDKRYFDRGHEIENLYVDNLIDDSKNSGFEAYAASNDYPIIDAYAFNKKTGAAEYYDVFTLNPFMKTYSERHSAIKGEIKKHGKRLMECETPEYLEGYTVKSLKRIVVFVIPENSEPYADEAYENAKDELKKYNIEVRLVKGYGSYTVPEMEPEEVQELKEAA